MEIESLGRRKDLIVPAKHVKRVKTALEEQNLLDKSRKIFPDEQVNESHEKHMIIPTIINIPAETEPNNNAPDQEDQKQQLLAQLHLTDIAHAITIRHTDLKNYHSSNPIHRNPILKALGNALQTLDKTLLGSLDLTIEDLVSTFPTTYTIYKPMLLLPPNTLHSPPWKKLKETLGTSSPILSAVWEGIVKEVGCTHLAINAGIPPTSTQPLPTTTEPDVNSKNAKDAEMETASNILRSPTHLSPLHGPFGPSPSPLLLSSPTYTDFKSAFWVHTTQNGIHQTWAPLYTMFSRGNIREKARILTLPSVPSSVGNDGEGGIGKGTECTAVDLYAGIGYFAFSYKKAGVDTVLCWELNPWSVEGLRRGAVLNGWTVDIIDEKDAESEAWMDRYLHPSPPHRRIDFLIFREDNRKAGDRLSLLAKRAIENGISLPPIRHVNCGLLPSSRESWATAVKAIDKEVGGWIHAHENVGVGDIEERRCEVVREMQGLIDACGGEDGWKGTASCEHVERVKTYAPGVVHVVFDVRVEWRREGGSV